MSRLGKLIQRVFIAAALVAGSTLAMALPATAGKVMWKENPKDPGCFALAFSDTGQWFATARGYAFKRGVCHGQEITFTVELADDGDSFTALGQNFCTFHVGNVHDISGTCHPIKTR